MRTLSLMAGLCLGASAWANVPANEPVEPIAAAEITDPAKVELGKQLFFDPRLSRSGFISCNSCHNLSMGGSDNLPSSIGHNWQQGPINSPTVLNSSLNLAQFWDGRAADLKEQAAGPIANPMEMAFTHILAIDVLRSIPQYRESFKAVYKTDEITLDEVTDAIAEFERPWSRPIRASTCGSRATSRPSARSNWRATSCSSPSAASLVTTARRWAATRSRRWGWSNPMKPAIRPRGWLA
ncbi:cytochrome-c peroxidase [Pseudomonas sihuiensis]|jgi:cytochrome c peroxidase